MGLLALLQKLRKSDREARLLVLGLDNSGKTTILKTLCDEEISNIMPTQGFNIKSVVQKDCKLNVWDIGGQKSIRPYWRNYFQHTDALIYVIDSSDKKRMDETREELHQLLEEEKLRSVPLLVLANKQDLLNSLSVEEIETILQINSIHENTRPRKIAPCSAKNGQGLKDGVEWILDHMNKH